MEIDSGRIAVEEPVENGVDAAVEDAVVALEDIVGIAEGGCRSVEVALERQVVGVVVDEVDDAEDPDLEGEGMEMEQTSNCDH